MPHLWQHREEAWLPFFLASSLFLGISFTQECPRNGLCQPFPLTSTTRKGRGASSGCQSPALAHYGQPGPQPGP